MKKIHVAAGVILNEKDEVLIALRPLDKHQGGLWEFPGGKVESGESVSQALARELLEELGLTVTEAREFLRSEHDYGDKQVILDVWLVSGFIGNICGREGQEIRWVALPELAIFSFPAANQPIVDRLLSGNV